MPQTWLPCVGIVGPMLAHRSTMTIVAALVASACGDDAVGRLPDAPLAGSITLAVAPASVMLGAGETTMVTATIVRQGYTGDVVVSATGASGDIAITGGTIAADATSIPLMVMATGTAVSATLDVEVAGAATGIVVEPASFAVTIRGRVGSGIIGEAAIDQSGHAIALSANGTRVIIGAPFNDGAGADAGHARVYDRMGTAWVQVGVDLDGEAAGDRYGGAVAISNDGSRIAIGSYLNDGNGNTSGHARVFDLVGTTWTQVGADLDGPTAASGHGWTLALSGTGSRIIVGAPSANNVNGNAYVYDLVGPVWTLVGAPIAGDHETGHDVDISDDGNRIAVSAPFAQSGDGWPGRVQIFEWSGAAWTLLGSPIMGAAASELAGGSVSMSANGETIAIGSEASDAGGMNSGSVRVFRWTAATSMWAQVGAPITGLPSQQLGVSVSLSADGTRLLVGAPRSPGTAQLYTLVGTTWTRATGPDFGSGGYTGQAVTLSADGSTAAIGSPVEDAPANQVGVVRVYDLP